MPDPIKVLTVELIDPSSIKDGSHYAIRIIEYDTDKPDTDTIINIVEREYFNRTSLMTAIDNLLDYTLIAAKED